MTIKIIPEVAWGGQPAGVCYGPPHSYTRFDTGKYFILRVFYFHSYVEEFYIVLNSFFKFRISFSFILNKLSKCRMSQDAIG